MANKIDKIEAMTEGGSVLGQIMERAILEARVGVSGLDIEKLVTDLMVEEGVEPSFKKVKGYKYATCICVNDTVVHGIPTADKFQKNDVVGIDIGVYHKGFHTDMSWSKVISDGADDQVTTQMKQFLAAGYQTLLLALKEAVNGRRIGNISRVIEQNIKANGLRVVKQLVGHAVGRELHEFPQIPGVLTKPIERTPLITPEMTLAVEIIYTQGEAEIVYKNNDGWTISTRDGKLSGLFEVTVAVLENETKILTPFGGLLKEPEFAIIS